MEHNNSFEYTYSAQQRQEVEAIRKEYLPKEKDKLEQLRALHEGPTKKAQAASIIVGVIGALVGLLLGRRIADAPGRIELPEDVE